MEKAVYACVGQMGMWETSVFSQFCHEPKTAVKYSLLKYIN